MVREKMTEKGTGRITEGSFALQDEAYRMFRAKLIPGFGGTAGSAGTVSALCG